MHDWKHISNKKADFPHKYVIFLNRAAVLSAALFDCVRPVLFGLFCLVLLFAGHDIQDVIYDVRIVPALCSKV